VFSGVMSRAHELPNWALRTSRSANVTGSQDSVQELHPEAVGWVNGWLSARRR
jgi:hypothetical protein